MHCINILSWDCSIIEHLFVSVKRDCYVRENTLARGTSGAYCDAKHRDAFGPSRERGARHESHRTHVHELVVAQPLRGRSIVSLLRRK